MTQVVTLPCVFAVGNAPSSYLRVPTLKDRMKRGKKPIEYLSEKQLELPAKEAEEGFALTALEPVRQERDGILIDGENAREKAEILYQNYLRERLETL